MIHGTENPTPLRSAITVDANEAVANVAYRTNEVIAIYPITPASPMGEAADMWAAAARQNIFGCVPQVIEMQSEAGAAGVLHGAVQTGALGTTFTSSQGLLLMIPNMFKIAGELSAAVIHVAARSIATHALSIFGDHSDVMAARMTGWAMLSSASVQEAQDFALISQAASLESRVPFMHFFDGFRTSHEVNKIEKLEPDDMAALIDSAWIADHRGRALNPDRPVLRGSAQNPDVFFQAREAANPFYLAVPGTVQRTFNRLAIRCGRQYHLFDYSGAPDADRVVVLMGSGAGAVGEAVDALRARGEKVGLLQVRLFRPFSICDFLAALPETTQSIAVLDRTKEPGSVGEPLYQDIVTALAETWGQRHEDRPVPRVIGGRYGLSSKEFTPAMAAAVFDELLVRHPKQHFTVGITDDVTHTSLKWNDEFDTEDHDAIRAVFYGLGSDGTVGANKNSVKIIGENTPLFAQGYFVYDSKKAGSTTVSHLRISRRPIRSTYLIRRANFVACHQFHFLERLDVLETAEPGAVFLLNSPYGPDEVWDHVPWEIQEQIIEKQLRFFVVDAARVSREVGLGGRINTVMQTCFFSLSEVMPLDEALGHIRQMIEKTYHKRGETIVLRNLAAVDEALRHMHEVAVPAEPRGSLRQIAALAATPSDFVQRVTALMSAGRGDLLPVSAMPVDGTFPTGTARFEKRSIAREIPIWDPAVCTQCGLCPLVCPHAAIRLKAFSKTDLASAPEGFRVKSWVSKDAPGEQMTIQVAPDDCTGCGVCVDVCPAKSKEAVKHKAINMEPKGDHLSRERENFEFFLGIPEADRTQVKTESIKGSQILQPLFEFSGACAGCGETPYLKLLSQLYGDRLLVGNATGCSSIYGGNLPTTPWSSNRAGRGPAWSNSLFEDSAEFGLGMRLALDEQEQHARRLLAELAPRLGEELTNAILSADQSSEAQIDAQRGRLAELKIRLQRIGCTSALELLSIVDVFVRRSVWIVGGDGWAYDIGFGGLDHVLTLGRNVNILVLDTGVYSNTGGQASKATPRAAVAKFATNGKAIPKKDLGMLAMAYGNVYVAQIALGANPLQTVRVFHEAESYPGPSLILAYSHCIAHGIDMSTSMSHQKEAVTSGFWPLYRYDPRTGNNEDHPFHLDSREPTLSFDRFAEKEGRFAVLTGAEPDQARALHILAQQDIDERWRLYQQMAGLKRTVVEATKGA